MLRALSLSLFILAAGCTEAPGVYPSLAKRPIESRPDTPPEPPAPETAKPDPALDAQIRTLLAQLAKADSDFADAAAKVERAAAVSGSRTVGSDAWIGAQAALADLEMRRGDSQSVLTDLERLVTDRGVAGEPPYPALDAARAKAQAQADAQNARLSAVKARLGEK